MIETETTLVDFQVNKSDLHTSDTLDVLNNETIAGNLLELPQQDITVPPMEGCVSMSDIPCSETVCNTTEGARGIVYDFSSQGLGYVESVSISETCLWRPPPKIKQPTKAQKEQVKLRQWQITVKKGKVQKVPANPR